MAPKKLNTSTVHSNNIRNYFQVVPKTKPFHDPRVDSDDDVLICEPIEKKRREDNDYDSDIEVIEVKCGDCFDKSDVQLVIEDLIDSVEAQSSKQCCDTRLFDKNNREFGDVCESDYFSINSSINNELINETQKTFDLIEDCHESNAQINALMTTKELTNVCNSLQLTPILNFDYHEPTKERHKSKTSKDEAVYEVESIYDASAEDGTNKVIYLVKWKNWAEEYNSWEPLSHLTNCYNLVEEFKAIERSDIPNITEIYRNFHRLKGIIEDLCDKKIDESTALTLLLKFCSISVKEFQYSKAHMQRLRNQVKDSCGNTFDKILNNSNPKSRISMMTKALKSLNQTLHINEKFQTLQQFFSFYEKRRNLQYKMNKWEYNINLIIKNEKEGETIRVENYVDLDVPPSYFHYITKCKPFDNSVTVCDDPPIYCDCDDCEQSQDKCCVTIHENPIVYNKNGILRMNQRKAIYECNKKCKCGQNCINRVIQKGRKHKLSIFRTDDDKGWGVRALEPILKGSFVMEYIGEIITVEEADKRGRVYDAEGRTYLFDLDYMPDDESDQHKYVVDATKCGNISHFVNHSCDPNLDSKVAWINNLDPFMPHIALFAVRHIKINEELTFDYKINVHGITEENKDNCSVAEVSRDCMRIECSAETVSNFSETGADSDDSGISLNNNNNKSEVNIVKSSTINENHLIRVQCRCGAQKCRKYLY